MSDYVIINGKPTIEKDPDATLDYTFKFDQWLDAVSDTILSAVVTVDAGINKVGVEQLTNGNKRVVQVISGGTPGLTYKARCRITTNSAPARIDDRTIYIKIKDR